MSEKITFAAKPRTVIGKKVSTLRTQKVVPANISGNVESSLAVEIDLVGFNHLYKRVGDTGLFYLKVEGEKKDRPVLVSEIQVDPITDQVLHIVFRQVNLSEKVTAEVPVQLVGEFDVKDGLLATMHDTVEVSALPQDLPEKFVIDISTLTEVGQMVTYRQLEIDTTKVSLEMDEEQLDNAIVMVQEVKAQVEEVAEATETTTEAAAPASQDSTEKSE